MKVVSPIAAVALLGALLGCASAYQRTYDAEMQKLEEHQQVQDARDKAAHAEASRYAAVIYFDSGSSELQEDGERELRWFVEKMQPYPEAIILVQGFADATGGDALNEDLSRDRANAVAGYLALHGIEGRRLEVSGFGADFEAAPNVTAKGRKSNRRVEVTVK